MLHPDVITHDELTVTEEAVGEGVSATIHRRPDLSVTVGTSTQGAAAIQVTTDLAEIAKSFDSKVVWLSVDDAPGQLAKQVTYVVGGEANIFGIRCRVESDE